MLHDHWRNNSAYQVKVYRIVIYALFYGKISVGATEPDVIRTIFFLINR